MKGTIEFKNGVLSVKLATKAPEYIHERLTEIGFLSTNSKKKYILAKGITESNYDYLEGIVQVSGLGMPYIPATQKGFILNTVVPDSMGYEMHIAIRKVKNEIGKSLFQYVKEKLKYTEDELLKSLAAEQVDSVALAIYNIEVKKQGIIIGDQTGIGKGRQAAAMIRYGIKHGVKPIFLSEKPNLFSDLYRDLVDIQSDGFSPFIINARESKTHIKDKNGNVVYEAPPKTEQDKIFKDQKLPSKFDFVCATYSQFNQPEKKPLKPQFLSAIAENNIIIMDEAHNSSGSSNTGYFLQSVLRRTKGVVFLSATFAKRPDNMPIYAQKTAMSEANMTGENLINAIINGGVALQEVLASQLVLEGQLVRRERSFEGVEVNYINLTDKSKEHELVADKVTAIIRDIILFQEVHITPLIEEMDGAVSSSGVEVSGRKGTQKAGVDNTPYFSKIFNVINQMLFAIKAEDVADHAIEMLKKGFKPIIAFSSTMGSFLEQIGSPDQIIKSDFSAVLMKGLNSVLTFTEHDAMGNSTKEMIDIQTLDEEAKHDYFEIVNKIESVATGITISPIDLIVQKIEQAGYTIGEVTGRKLALRFDTEKKNKGLKKINTSTALVEKRKRENSNDLFRKYNDNELDVLLINQSGSTGASAHAIVTDKVSKENVKKRLMIILQAELDINTEIQKRGRINRTGQIYKPRYDYITSTIPAEKRLMMMLQKKLKSLDANTTSNQKSSENQLKTDDFLNKYGDVVVRAYLQENPLIAKELGSPLGDEEKAQEGDAHKVSGRVAILPVKEQEKFYNEVLERYSDYVDYLIQSDSYDLELATLNLQAKTLERKVTKAGKGGSSAFGQDTFLEKAECNVLRKPYKTDELKKQLSSSLNGSSATEITAKLVDVHNNYSAETLEKLVLEQEEKYDKLISKISDEAGYKKSKTEVEKETYIQLRTMELEDGRIKDIEFKTKQINHRKQHINGLLQFFYVGRGLAFPVIGFGQMDTVPATCLGVDVNLKRSNPFAPSAIKVKIATSDSRKYLSLALSGETGSELERVQSRSLSLSKEYDNTVLEKWEEYISGYSKSRTTRYILTGNLLQAAGDLKGKLTSYTTLKGDSRKGVLMPENWHPNQKGSSETAYVVVSAKDAIPYIRSMTKNASATSENGIGIFRNDAGFKFIINKGKANAGVYKDTDIIALCESEYGFTVVSGAMVAVISVKNIDKMLTLMGERFGVSFKVSRSVFEQIVEPNRAKTEFDEDSYIKAKEQFLVDKAGFNDRLEKQNKPKKKTDKNRIKLKLKLRAKALMILQKQAA